MYNAKKKTSMVVDYEKVCLLTPRQVEKETRRKEMCKHFQGLKKVHPEASNCRIVNVVAQLMGVTPPTVYSAVKSAKLC